jgi:hypothetical protein
VPVTAAIAATAAETGTRSPVRTLITGLRWVRDWQDGLPLFRSTDDQGLGSAIATLRIDSVENAFWCRRLNRLQR